MKKNNQYLSTFISGVSEVVGNALETYFPDIQTELVLDGFTTYRTSMKIDSVQQVRFFNNTFVIVKQFDDLYGTYFKPMYQWAFRHGFGTVAQEAKQFKTFRIIASDKNEMISINKHLLKDLEKKVTHDTGMQVDRFNPDTEIWIYHRSEGYGFIMLRLTNQSSVEHRQKGQLRHELANLMGALARSTVSDTMLDPFAGYGTIVNELATFSHKRIIAYEKENNILEVGVGIDTKIGDFFENDLKDGAIDKIVTDPPWGIFNDSLETQKFYNDMFSEFDRLLSTGGRIVLLANRNESLASNRFKIINTYDVLVSGKKATIYVFQKVN